MDIKGTGDLSAIGGVNISLFNLPGIKFDVTKLIDPTAKGFNKVFNIVLGRVHADKIRHIALSAAQTDADVKKIERGVASYNTKEQTLTETTEDLKSLIVSAIQEEEIINILRCSMFATTFIDGESDHSEPSRGFINRWRNDAKQISHEDLQIIWGGILSAQINTPNSVSLRTLDIVRNLTRQEAGLFHKASKNALWGEFVPSTEHLDVGILNETGLMFAPLHASGFGSGHKFPKSTFTIENNEVECYYLRTAQDIFLIPSLEVQIPPNAPGWNLSTSGKELLKATQPKTASYSEELYQKTHELVLLSIGRSTNPKGKNFAINGYHSKSADTPMFRKIKLESLGAN